MNRCEDPRVYQKPLVLVGAVYRPSGSWPAEERFGPTGY